MGTYLTAQDVVDRIGSDAAARLTTDSGTTPNTTKIDAVITEAEGEAHGYLARRYAVPVDLTSHPDVEATLRGHVMALTLYRLYALRPPVSETHRNGRNDAVEWLKGVAKGEIVLPAATTPASQTSDTPVASWGSSSANASRETIV
ncbi:MAG: DUF1320 domain-containing protein [Phycisphaerae bacterium]|nr:DUF1320 domain-containing protein [Phycisphaerae bacterium]